MGDKSPKSKVRKQKQDAADKSRKQAAAFAKANPEPPMTKKTSKK